MSPAEYCYTGPRIRGLNVLAAVLYQNICFVFHTVGQSFFRWKTTHVFFSMFHSFIHLHKELSKTNVVFLNVFNFSIHLHKEHSKTTGCSILSVWGYFWTIFGDHFGAYSRGWGGDFEMCLDSFRGGF